MAEHTEKNIWQYKDLKDVADFKIGKTPPRNDKRYWDKGVYPWVAISDMTPFGYVSNTEEMVSESAHDNVFRKRISPKGTVLMSFKLTIGRTSKLTIDAYHNEAIVSIFPKKGLDGDFLFYYLPTIDFENYQDTAVKGKTLNKGKIEKLKIALPSLAEQKAIVHTLATLQNTIAEQVKLVLKLSELKRATIHHLFVSGTHNEKTKLTELGEIPESWGVGKLKDVCDLLNGYAFKSADYIDHSHTLNVRMSNIKPNGIFEIEYNKRYLPDSYAEKYAGFLINEGDIVIAMTDMANDPKILGIPTIIKNSNGRSLLLNQRVGKLTGIDTRKIDIAFLQIVLSQERIRRFYKSIAKKGVQINLGKGDILSALIPLPSIDEQKRISNAIILIDKKVEIVNKKLHIYRNLFKTLLHELMSGERRIVI